MIDFQLYCALMLYTFNRPIDLARRSARRIFESEQNQEFDEIYELRLVYLNDSRVQSVFSIVTKN